MVCPPVQGVNPRALASGLSPVQADQPLFFSTLISVDLAQYAIFYAKTCNFWQGWYNYCFLKNNNSVHTQGGEPMS